jgi:lysophospholipase L1-like esterase
VVTGVQNGSYTAAIRNDTLPPFYRPGAPLNVQVPVADGVQLFVPIVLPIGQNTPNQYLAFGDSITRGDGDTAGGYPARLQGRLRGHFGVANVRNRGADATNSYEALERLDRNLFNDAFALILYGTNDWNIQGCQSDPSLCPTVENLRIVVQRVKAAGTLPFIATLTPANPRHQRRPQQVDRVHQRGHQDDGRPGRRVPGGPVPGLPEPGRGPVALLRRPGPSNAAGYDVMANGWFEAIAHGRSTPP